MVGDPIQTMAAHSSITTCFVERKSLYFEGQAENTLETLVFPLVSTGRERVAPINILVA